jgi:hypothetical protein
MITTPLVLAVQAALSSSTSATAAELQSKDQALLDAVAIGDRSTWDRALSSDAVYVDEAGQIMARTDFLSALAPLPTGVSGSLAIVDYRARLVGDTALVIHRDEEHEDYHGQALAASYLTTETWVRHDGEWRLAMVHVYAVNKDPPSITIARSKLDEYVGRYSAAPELAWIIRRDGDHLVGGREGKPQQPLLFEAFDVMFVPGQPRVRKLFHRNDQGRVTGYLDRREGQDVRWTRIPSKS